MSEGQGQELEIVVEPVDLIRALKEEAAGNAPHCKTCIVAQALMRERGGTWHVTKHGAGPVLDGEVLPRDHMIPLSLDVGGVVDAYDDFLDQARYAESMPNGVRQITSNKLRKLATACGW